MLSLQQIGSRGTAVSRVQELLNNHLVPTPGLKVDGVFGPRTEGAVRRYQASIGIGIDGVVGVHTWAALERGLTSKDSIVEPIAPDFTRAPWMTIAMREIGQAQLPNSMHNQRILQYHSTTTLGATSDETAWCSSFVNWCLREAGLPGTKSAAANSWLHWGSMCGPAVGAITIIYEFDPPQSRSGYHVGFWIEDAGRNFRLLGGNQSKMVRISAYPKSGWVPVGHRWPRLQGEKKENGCVR